MSRVFAVLILSCTACSTMSHRTKTLLLMAGTGVAVGTVGALTAPSAEHASLHGLYKGGLGAAVAGVVGLYLFDEQKRSEEGERKRAVLQKELQALRGEGASSDARLLYETNAPFGKTVPLEYRSLVQPGNWSVWSLDQWVNQGEGVMVHQDRMMKLVPAQLSVQPIENSRSVEK